MSCFRADARDDPPAIAESARGARATRDARRTPPLLSPRAPSRRRAAQWIVFFVFFMLMGGYFIVNLFVGVLLNKFKEKKAEKHDDNKTQRQWLRLTDGLLAAVGNQARRDARRPRPP